jgi:hypothetical protein
LDGRVLVSGFWFLVFPGPPLAPSPLAVNEKSGGRLQYTIEARELTSRPPHDGQSRRTVIEANDESEAIHQYLRESDAELVSFTTPHRSSESIATVKKEDTILLVRVYAA